jgi:hypothetical protein
LGLFSNREIRLWPTGFYLIAGMTRGTILVGGLLFSASRADDPLGRLFIFAHDMLLLDKAMSITRNRSGCGWSWSSTD